MERFKQLGEISEDKLICKFPGMNIIYPYSKGIASINKAGTIACLKLDVNDRYAEKIDELGDDPIESIIAKSRDLSYDLVTELRESMVKYFENKNIYLMYSETKNSPPLLSILGGSDGNTFYATPWGNIFAYDSGIKVPQLGEVYGLHLSIIGTEKIISDHDKLKEISFQLADKANTAYEYIKTKKKEQLVNGLLKRMVGYYPVVN
jgi:hypothetical protein